MNGRHPLGVLITHTREVNHWSLEDVVKRARDKGYSMSRSNLSNLANKPVESMTANQINTLAAGLQLPPRTVLAAFLATMGLDLGDGRASAVEDAIRADGRLSTDERELIVDLVRLTRKRRSSSESRALGIRPGTGIGPVEDETVRPD